MLADEPMKARKVDKKSDQRVLAIRSTSEAGIFKKSGVEIYIYIYIYIYI